MSVELPKVLRENMDKWNYDDDGKMVPVKGASFSVIQAINKMNKLEEQNNPDNMIIND